MMAPSFAGGTITGEKERKTYEMLLASPLRPSAIVFGKLVASLAHLAVLILTSLPIVVLCLPLGGVSVYEVLSAYLALIVSVLTFGMISIACSSYFQRTGSSLAVSYLVILPLALSGVLVWQSLSGYGSLRVFLTITLLPAIGTCICVALFINTSARLLHPPDVGAEGQEVVDLEQESQDAIGLVIQPDQFPDNLFAPAKRTTLMEDGVNPIYDKEIRSEIFSHGTLMLRVVIQVSILLALPVMAFCLFLQSQYAPWYVAYVLLFNMLVGPVFSAGSVTSERERQTLELLLTTVISPREILFGKLLAGLRVSSVLTLFLVWPVLLAAVFLGENHPFWTTFVAYLGIILGTCITTATLALFHSVLFRKTSHSLLASYLVIIVLFCFPLAINYFASRFYPSAELTAYLSLTGITSPLAVTFALPLSGPTAELIGAGLVSPWVILAGYGFFTLTLLIVLLGVMVWLFHRRWRVVD
jgi:ABC-type transport system involved in multi-copper enzyme maturation permease subunit